MRVARQAGAKHAANEAISNTRKIKKTEGVKRS